MKTKTLIVSCSLLFLSLFQRGATSSDFDVFCELVSLNNHTDLCSNCSNPCGSCSDVTCNGDKTRITKISVGSKKLTALPESIGNLTSLNNILLFDN